LFDDPKLPSELPTTIGLLTLQALLA